MTLTPTYRGLRHFARTMLRDDRLPLAPLIAMRTFAQGTEAVLYRSGPWQVELCSAPGGVAIARHRHNRASSMDLVLAGSLEATIGGRTTRSDRARGRLLANLVPVPQGVWHEGRAGPNGVVYLSFQHWTGPIGFLSEDWDAP